MVLSFSVPSFSRSASSENNPPHRSLNPSSSSTARPLGKLPWKGTSVLGSSSSNRGDSNHRPSSSSGSGGLTRSSRNSAAAAATAVVVTEGDKERDEQRREQEELNAGLETLARVFPDVKIEVFREMLVRFDGDSRLEVCVEQLLRYKTEWVAGRWNVPNGPRDGNADQPENQRELRDGDVEDLVPAGERFRSDEYKVAVRTVLAKEFTSLSRSTVDAVLAEVNFCYLRARPMLRDLSQKTWRATLNNLFPTFKRRKARERDDHPLLVWQQQQQQQTNGDPAIPRLKETGCQELDRELHEALLAPLLRQRRADQEGRDFQLAAQLNENEAQAAEALYECACCLADVTFEQISSCGAASHIICYGCIQRTVHEALFGQGWNQSVDTEKSTLRCLAPLAHGSCEGSLPPEIVSRAILLDKAGRETHRKFEDRLASEALLRSRFKLIRCPFCSYAEVDPVYHPSVRGVQWRFRQEGTLPTILMTLLLIDLICFLAIPMTLLWLQDSATVPAILQNSLLNLCLKVRPKRFTCAHPGCRRASCITCQKPWRDPHVCHEPLLLDLRATVEAARTAAVKRTCPRCGLSFIKSSGCNKLTCVCGYSMCYLCRKALGPPLEPALPPPRHPPEANNDADDDHDEPGGYRHFCEHFRVNPGSSCTECTKCDLYQAEDEDSVARRAGERAERDWRVRQGITSGVVPPGVGNRNINHDYGVSMSGSADGKRKPNGNPSVWDMVLGNWRYWAFDMWWDGQWKLEGQALVDSLVERVVVIDEV